MQVANNKRVEVRLKYKNIIQYEELLDNAHYGTPLSAKTFDIGTRGIGFFTNQEFKLNSQIKITCYISNSESISFVVSVKRIQINKDNKIQYIVGAEIIDISDKNKEELKVFLQEIDMFQILDKIDLKNAVDIHFLAGAPITLKKAGKLKTVGKVLDGFTVRNLLLNLLDDERYNQLMKVKDVNFALSYQEKRLRFNVHFQQGKVEGICRIVNSRIPTPSQLGFPPIVERLVKNNSQGLIIISGRTGSGKSTTLASIVNYLSKVISGVIISIEDPIEYIQEKNQCVIKQREIGDDTISYTSAIRNALRQNPDVLVIGEILEKEALDLVLTAAEAGTLVLTTFHSANTVQVLDRIPSFFPGEVQKHVLTRLSLVLKGIIVQELFPRIMGNEGLVLASEIFLPNDMSKKVIREGDWKQIPDIILKGKAQGMQTMKESIEDLVKKGIVDMDYLKEFYPISNT